MSVEFNKFVEIVIERFGRFYTSKFERFEADLLKRDSSSLSPEHFATFHWKVSNSLNSVLLDQSDQATGMQNLNNFRKLSIDSKMQSIRCNQKFRKASKFQFEKFAFRSHFSTHFSRISTSADQQLKRSMITIESSESFLDWNSFKLRLSWQSTSNGEQWKIVEINGKQWRAIEINGKTNNETRQAEVRSKSITWLFSSICNAY